MKRLAQYTLFFLSTLLLTACGTISKDIDYSKYSAQQIYTMANTSLQKEHFSDAITQYQALDANYPFGPEAQKGDLETIYAYYVNQQPDLALLAATRYINLYPSSPYLDYAYYMKGVINLNQGASFLQKYLHYDLSEHNTAAARAAYRDFSTYLQKYPTSPYAADARLRMIYLRNALAQFELNVAQYDFRRQAYLGALRRCNEIIQHYPQTPAVEDALQLGTASAQALNLKGLAHDYHTVLNATYPAS